MKNNFLVDNLRYLKMINNYTNSDVIEGTGLKSFGNYASGRVIPPVDILIIIADFFEVTLDDLVRVDMKQGRIRQVEEDAVRYSGRDLEARIERIEQIIEKIEKKIK